jgi:hypothetical protein
MDVFMMTGTLTANGTDEPHAWNAVKVDGKWVYLDMTNSLDGGKSYIMVSEKRLRNCFTFDPPKGLNFDTEEYDIFNKNHLSFNTPKEAGEALTKLITDHPGKKVPIRLEVDDMIDHGDEILAAINLSGMFSYLFRMETQTYLFERK